MPPPTLLTLPSEIRQLIYSHLFTSTTCSPRGLPPSAYYTDFCEVCQSLPPTAPAIATAILPLLTCRQIYLEATPHFYANLTIITTHPRQAYALTCAEPRRLARNLRHLEIYNHLDLHCPHIQASALEKLFAALLKLSLQTVVIHNHMHPPSSYDLLCPGIHYIAPLLSQPTPHTTWPTSVVLKFAYRWDYEMFSSPLLGEIRTSDALGEHEAVLRELLDDEQFRDGVKEGSEEEQTWALLRVARSHERGWLEGLRRRRWEALSEAERRELEAEIAEEARVAAEESASSTEDGEDDGEEGGGEADAFFVGQ